MSSLDLISCRRVRSGQRVPEQISKEKMDAEGIMGGISAGGTLSFGIHPKTPLPGARWIHRCDPSSSHPTQVHEGCEQSSECPLSFPESTSWLLNPMWTLLAASWSSRHATMQSFCGRYTIQTWR